MRKNSRKRDYKDFLMDIYYSIELIEKFVNDFDFEKFYNEDLIQLDKRLPEY